jgi:regulatory protein
MKITAIEEQKKHKDRASVYLDGSFAFGVKLDLLWEYHLKVGLELDADKVAQIQADDAFLRGYDRALTFLAVRPRSTQEVRQHMRDKLIYKHPDYPEIRQDSIQKADFIETQTAAIERIMAKLVQDRYLDDVAFAKWWIDNRRTFRPRGQRLLLVELKSKGISDSDLASALTTPNEEGHYHSEVGASESDLATTVATKYMRKYAGTPESEWRPRLSRHLASKGFDWETIERVTSIFRTAHQEETDDL